MEQKIEELKEQKNLAVKNQQYEEAANLRDTESKLVRNLEFAKVEWEEDLKIKKFPVTEEDISEVIAMMTGIPVKRVAQSEGKKLFRMAEDMKQVIIGQDNAIVKVVKAIQRNRVGLKDPKKPIGSFIFLGPTGVGKTELAKALARFLFDSNDALIRIDMTEYMEKFSISRLIGAPPGYVGYEEGGQLTEAVRRRPYSIILLDEIEKAHPDTFNILLQVLDDGRLTDNKGRIASFKNTVIIMTSNMGADKILENFEDLEALGDKKRTEIIEATKLEVFDLLKQNMRPEFLNRIDDKIMFLPLNKDEIKQIARIQIKAIQKNLVKQNLSIELSDNALNLLVDLGFDPQFGARPLKRVIQGDIIDELARYLLSGAFASGDTILVDTDIKGFTFKSKLNPNGQIMHSSMDSTETDMKANTTKSNIVDKVNKAAKEVKDAVNDIKNDPQDSQEK